MLIEEKKLLGAESCLAMVDETCWAYKVPEVSQAPLDSKLVKRAVRIRDKLGTWLSNLKSPVRKNVGLDMMRISSRLFKLNKKEAQAMIAYNAGSLKFRTAWGSYYEDRSCRAPMCDQDDEFDHIQKCPFYESKWQERFVSDIKLLTRWLVSINRERIKKWKCDPLF